MGSRELREPRNTRVSAEALNTERSDEIIELLNMCIKSLDKASQNTLCQPPNSSAQTYVWPMDIESLAWGEAMPADEIILSSVDEAAWSIEVVSRGRVFLLKIAKAFKPKES